MRRGVYSNRAAGSKESVRETHHDVWSAVRDAPLLVRGARVDTLTRTRMVRAFIKFGDGRVSNDASHRNIAAALRDPGAMFWVDIEKPEDEDYAILDEVFGFHPLAIEDSINRSQRPKIESYNHVGDACQQGYFYMVIHGAEMPKGAEKLKTEELDMFVSERYLLTIHDEPMTALAPLLVRAEGDPRLVLDPGIDLL